MKALEIEHASVIRGGRTILRDASLCITPGEFVAIAGPNGSGKSTLLRTLAGLWSPSVGAVRLSGRALHDYPRREVARTIAFVPQETRIDFAFTVRELISMGRYPHRGRFARETRSDMAAVQAAMKQCDVQHLADRYANTLSGGERQRVLIARSLAVDPSFILLDEPTASLDVEHSLEVLDLCSALAREGKAVAVTTHDINAAARYATKVVLLSAGKVAREGPGDQVLTAGALEEVFGVRTEFLFSQNGQPVYLFHRRSD
jgi:iron complex transport system ATP-binding protein